MFLVGLALLSLSTSAFAIHQSSFISTTPVPILKQINRHNDDGSYTYGFQAADGTFKIETKRPSGEVFGKYGYVGDDGQFRTVEYGASKRGFEPKGSHINVAPPTISNSVDDDSQLVGDNGRHGEKPIAYGKENVATLPRVVLRKKLIKSSQKSSPPSQTYLGPGFYQSAAIQNHFHQPGILSFIPQQPRFPAGTIAFDPAIFSGHPATNIDINTGSYSVSYTS